MFNLRPIFHEDPPPKTAGRAGLALRAMVGAAEAYIASSGRERSEAQRMQAEAMNEHFRQLELMRAERMGGPARYSRPPAIIHQGGFGSWLPLGFDGGALRMDGGGANVSDPMTGRPDFGDMGRGMDELSHKLGAALAKSAGPYQTGMAMKPKAPPTPTPGFLAQQHAASHGSAAGHGSGAVIHPAGPAQPNQVGGKALQYAATGAMPTMASTPKPAGGSLSGQIAASPITPVAPPPVAAPKPAAPPPAAGVPPMAAPRPPGGYQSGMAPASGPRPQPASAGGSLTGVIPNIQAKTQELQLPKPPPLPPKPAAPVAPRLTANGPKQMGASNPIFGANAPSNARQQLPAAPPKPATGARPAIDPAQNVSQGKNPDGTTIQAAPKGFLDRISEQKGLLGQLALSGAMVTSAGLMSGLGKKTLQTLGEESPTSTYGSPGGLNMFPTS